MEHVVQFGVTVDDDKIEQMIMEKAKAEITREMYDRVRRYADRWQDEIFREAVRAVVNEEKDKIITLVVANVTSGLVRTKAVKEAVAERIKDEEH